MSAQHAAFSFFRHDSFCLPGKWLANINAALGEFDQGWCVHADCVVDDFGNLTPVDFRGFTSQRTFGKWGRA